MINSLLNTISSSSSYSKGTRKKSVLTPDGMELPDSETISETRTVDKGLKGKSTTVDEATTNYTDTSGRLLRDVFSGNQDMIKKNLEKRKNLLSQGIGAGKSLLGDSII
jgi:hypothetical protein